VGAKKILILLFGLVALGLVVLGIAAALTVPRLVEERVVAEARARGVELVPGKISFGIGWVQVTDARLGLLGVRGLSVRAGVIDAELRGLTPVRFRMARVQADGVGPALPFAQQLAAWLRAQGPKLREPLVVNPLSFTWREVPKDAPQIALDDAELRFEDERSALTAKRAMFGGKALGELRVRQSEQNLRADVTFDQSALDNPLLSLEFSDGSEQRLHVALAPVTLGRLGQIAGMELPHASVQVTGTVDARIPNNLAAGGHITGRVDVTLKGYVPPHPVELDGFVFGDTTTIGTAYRMTLAPPRIVLEQTTVKAGTFVLVGGGEIRLEGLDARLALLLSGDLPCSALAGAAAETRLGRALGQVAGKAVRQIVEGRVGVRVSVDALASAPGSALVLKTITPGCGLKPLTLQELVKLGELVPETLHPAVARDFEKLLQKNLPSLVPPAGSITFRLPTLDALPRPPRTGANTKRPLTDLDAGAPASQP
jgi:ADP-dependent NAD(P)H-hydrate dehydratase / NAD(P)H-hydrate epimerase